MIPPSVASTIIGVHGDRGRAWLADAPSIIRAACMRWGVTLDSPFPQMSYHYVAPGVLREGTRVVLKAGVPSREMNEEMAALRQFTGHGGVRLIDADLKGAVLLLERAMPGVPLDTLDHDEEETRIAVRLARRLWREPSPGAPFKSLRHLFEAFGRHRARHGGGAGPIPDDLLDLAESLVPPLLQSSPRPVLLHGDLHHHNILSAGREGWVVIDPPGAIGDPAAEFGMFLCNPHPRVEATIDLPALMATRIDIIAAETGFERQRLIRWGISWATLSACWHDEDGTEGVPYAIRCARAIAALL